MVLLSVPAGGDVGGSPMSFVQRVDAAGEVLNDRSWELVEEKIREIKAKPHSTISLYGPRNAQMMLEYVAPHGYFISTFDENGTEEWVPVDDDASSDMISVDISDNVDEVPKNILINEKDALSIAKEFYLYGTRRTHHSWKKSIDLL